MNNRFFEFLSDVYDSWNSIQLVLSRGIGSFVTGIFMAIVICCANIDNASEWDSIIAKGYWLVFALCLTVYGIYQLNKFSIANRENKRR